MSLSASIATSGHACSPASSAAIAAWGHACQSARQELPAGEEVWLAMVQVQTDGGDALVCGPARESVVPWLGQALATGRGCAVAVPSRGFATVAGAGSTASVVGHASRVSVLRQDGDTDVTGASDASVTGNQGQATAAYEGKATVLRQDGDADVDC